MIRKVAGFKYAVLGLFSVALVSVACSDDDDAVDNGGAGKGGGGTSSTSAGTAGKGSTAGSNSSGSATGGNANGGSGTAGKTSMGGNAGTGTAGNGTAGTEIAGGAGGVPATGGAGGEPDMPMGGEAGAGNGASGAGGEGGAAPFVPDVLDNPGFEVGTAHTVPTGWTNEGTDGAAYVEYQNARSGFGKLSHYKDYVQGVNYTARTYQTVAPIANGMYSFSIWVDRNYFPNQHLFARGFNAADANAEMTQSTEPANTESGYFKITLMHIPVTSGSVTVGVDSSVETGTYANFDDAELTLE